MPTIEKRPGPDWLVYYRDVINGDTESMSVFGCASPEEAIAEARWSLTSTCETEEEKDWFEILALVRQGTDIEVQASSR
jgi:hypothetical protein